MPELGSGGGHARARPGSAAALRLRNRGDGLGRDRRGLRGRGARPPRAAPSGSRATTTRSSASTGLEPASRYEYEVRLDGEVRWPRAGLGAAAERDPHRRRRARTSTSASAPAGSRFRTRRPSPNRKTRPRSATRSTPSGSWRSRWRRASATTGPSSCSCSATRSTSTRARRRRARRSRNGAAPTPRPFDEVTDFEEYTWLYQESWEEPLIRWLFSNVSVSMLWDDHDMSDDWNISRGWLLEMQQKSWWHRRVVGCIASYWIYQHIGNLSPRELAENDLYQRVRGNQTAEEEIFPWAHRIQSMGDGTRWSFCRDFGRTRAIFIDSRAGAGAGGGPAGDRRRRGVGLDRRAHASGDFDHLLICTTIPWLLSPAFDRLEAWNEQALRRRLGQAGRLGEREAAARSRLRPLGRLRRVLREAARPPARSRHRRARQGAGLDRRPLRRRPPRLPGRGRLSRRRRAATAADAPRLPGGLLALPQPARRKRAAGGPRGLRQARSPPSPAAGESGRRAGPGDPLAHPRRAPTSTTRWRRLEIDGRRLRMRLDKTVPGEEGKEALKESFSRRLA